MRRQGRRSCLGFLLCVSVALALPGEARAEKENNLSGRFGFVFVGRNNRGELGDQYRLGMLFGVSAGLELNLEDSPWSLGLGLTTLVRGYYFASSTQAVDQTADVTEINMGVRLRRRMPGSIHHLSGSLGGGLSASNVPLPPAFDRRYLGLYGGLGYDRRLFGEWVWGLEARYAVHTGGPRNLDLFATITAGFGK